MTYYLGTAESPAIESLHLRIRPAGRQVGHHLPNECLPTDRQTRIIEISAVLWLTLSAETTARCYR